MKTFMVLLILCSIISIKAQNDSLDALHDSELLIYNISTNSQSIRVKVYPVSMVFNGDFKYDLNAFHPLNSSIVYNYINSRNTSNHEFDILPNGSFVGYNHDKGSFNSGTRGCVGFGKYKVEVRKLPGLELVDTCTIEFDAGYPGTLDADVTIRFRDDNNGIGGSGPRLTFKWSPCDEQNITAVNKTIQAWNQCSGQTRDKEYGEMIYSTNNGNSFTVLPQDFRQDCGSTENYPLLTGQYGTGLLTLNLTIDKDITTRSSFNTGEWFEKPAQIVITPQCTLKINDNKNFDIIKDPDVGTNTDFYNILTIKGNAWLRLNPGSTMLLESTNWLILEKSSHLYLGSGALLSCPKGSIFCNRGSSIVNNGKIIVRGITCGNPGPNSPVNISGSGTFELDSATYYIPDSTTYTFDTNAVLLCKPGTTIIFGKTSKLNFQNGASINANGCKFVSEDSTQTWDGIYLSGLSYDTLKNCTFQNAVNGINITDKIPTGLYSPPATQITNCVFKNSTSSTLLNYVYIDNSTNVLIKGCSSSKTGSGSFTSGIVAEYCSTNGIVIADNNINYVTTGISLLQSSEYVGRNTITGSTNSGTGMYLDNSNGTIEYNIVNNFQKSIYGSYSSPYLLKNTLSNAYVKNIDLVSSSMPVMKPIVSGSTLRWLGGNNTITGTPSHSGISFVDCYPLMDSGYNKITVGSSDYMKGTFSMALTTVNAKLNYWYDSPPNSHLFDITGGSVNYSNPFDGTTLPSTDATELNSLGWGLYDTVFTKAIGDFSEGEDLFMQAYTEEMSSNYTDAIADYKEVVSSYKTSSFAPVSLSRIFNCLGKANSSSSDYQSIQNYYSNINSNQTHPYESRELAEDFMIQSKVKQGNIGDAVSDYNDIYEENSSNSKGAHALLNKICLENMLVTDYSSGTGNHKIDVLSLITGEKININNFTNNNTPKQFKLHQNYPNPFNPVTNIKYEISRDVNVSIKIYDILGKEVFSYNDFKKAGSYEVQFDGANFASGMYFYQLTAGEFAETKKMVLIK